MGFLKVLLLQVHHIYDATRVFLFVVKRKPEWSGDASILSIEGRFIMILLYDFIFLDRLITNLQDKGTIL